MLRSKSACFESNRNSQWNYKVTINICLKVSLLKEQKPSELSNFFENIWGISEDQLKIDSIINLQVETFIPYISIPSA